MLEQLLVQLQYPYTANCSKCSHILFEIKLIDQFLRTKDIEGQHLQKQQSNDIKYTAKFYLLAQGIIPSSLQITKSTYLSQQKPFYMQFLGQIKCLNCKQKIGIKMLTVSSSFHYPELLDRIMIYVDKVKIRTLKEDVTEQVVARFRDVWEQETSSDQLELSATGALDNKVKAENKEIRKQGNKKVENRKKQGGLQKKEKTVPSDKPLKAEQAQLKYLRKQLQKQSDEQKQIIQQIVSSVDFFNEVLTTLQKRISQAQNVCNVLKQRVQKIVPLIRRKTEH